MAESRLVRAATGLLQTFNVAGVLEPADVHVALRLGRLGGEGDERVLLAAALAVRAVRVGAVCVDLNRLADISLDDEFDTDPRTLPWPETAELVAALQHSPLTTGAAADPLRPLILVSTTGAQLLYLDRYHRQEQTVRTVLDQRAAVRTPVHAERLARDLRELFPDPADAGRPSPAPDRQRIAAALALTRSTTIITGGPGTGKTTTVARIIALLQRQHGPGLRIALAAPTGKAAAQLQESVNAQAAGLQLPAGLTATTVHRLLGWQPGNASRFRHNADNHLPHDVVILDETSMVSLTLMARLLEALRPQARLLLVGDPDQLTSVEAGAVLADLVARPTTGSDDPVLHAAVRADLDAHGDSVEAEGDSVEAPLSAIERERLRDGVIRLSRGRRYGGTIAELAEAVRDGQAERAVQLLTAGAADVSLHQPEDLDALRADVLAAHRAVTGAAVHGDVPAAITHLQSHRLLCAHRAGPHGVQRWAQQAVDWISAATGTRLDPDAWYPGQPLLVTTNSYDDNVYNGDTGVVVIDTDGELKAAFQRGTGPILLPPSRLAAVQTTYAMTIHRSQGSQYDTVTVMLPEVRSSLLSRQLLYTAITRARRHVRIIGTEDAVRAGIGRQVQRASGLRLPG